jgi:transaldolase
MDAEAVLAEFAKAGIDTDGLAAQLLGEGIASFDKSWNDLLVCIDSKSDALKAA